MSNAILVNFLFLFTNFRIYSFVTNLFHFLRSVHLYIHKNFALLSGGEIEIVTVNWLVFPDLNIITILSFCCIWWHLLKWDFQNRKKYQNWFCGVNSLAQQKRTSCISINVGILLHSEIAIDTILYGMLWLFNCDIAGYVGEADFKWFANLWCEF